MIGHMQKAGMTMTPEPELADVMVVNTCAFIDQAKQEAIDAILDVVRARESGAYPENQKLIVAGCLSQRFQKELARPAAGGGRLHRPGPGHQTPGNHHEGDGADRSG